MGRGRGKGKRSSASNNDDGGSGEEEKIPAQKRRGRPQKPLLKDEIDNEEEEEEQQEQVVLKTEEEDEIGNKRKRYSQVKDKSELSVKPEDNGNAGETIKSNGFRHNGSRRKSKPRRAAEAGVECR